MLLQDILPLEKKRIDDEPGFYRYVSIDDYNMLLNRDEFT